MAEFRDQFEELFGPIPEYDPIEIGRRGQRRALNIQGGAPSIDPSGRGRRALEFPDPPSAPPDDDDGSMLSDVGKDLLGGVIQVGELAVGIPEYAARQASRLAGFATDKENFGEAVLGDLAGGIHKGRQAMAGARESIWASMSPEAVEQAGREWTTLDPAKTIWQGGPGEVGAAILHKFMRALPTQAAMLLPFIRMARVGSPNAITYLGASEAGLSLGEIANSITDEIVSMSHEELMDGSQRYAELFGELGHEETARNQLIAEAQKTAPIIGGALVGAISATAGRYLLPVIQGTAGKGLARRAGTFFAVEAPQEFTQGATEQLTQNIAAHVYDADRKLSEGVLEAGVEEGVIGGLTGGVIGGVAGGGRRPGEEEAEVTPTDETPAAPPPASFEDVFGTEPRDPRGQPFDDIFTAPDERTFLEQRAALDEGDARRFGIDVSTDPVDPLIAAAISNIHRDDTVQDMFPETTDPTRGDPAEIAGRQDQFSFQYPAGPRRRPGEVVPSTPPGQLDLPLTRREPGYRSVPDPGGPAAVAPPATPDMSQPPGVPFDERQGDMVTPIPQGVAPAPAPAGVRQPLAGEVAPREQIGYIVQARDATGVIEEDLFDTAEEAEAVADTFAQEFPDANITVQPFRGDRPAVEGELEGFAADQPTAEPLADIQAQLQDMEDQASEREGVFLSADNLARLEADGLLDTVKERGVQLTDFDSKGGLLIARDREAADGFLELREGGFPMQAILGAATLSGTGKPAGGQLSVQLRDEAGNVIRETLVETEAEAYALAEKLGDRAVVLTAEAALARRAQRVAEEKPKAEEGKAEVEAAQKAERAALRAPEEVGEEIQGLTRGAKTPSRAAARLIGEAAKKTAQESQKRIGGFFPPGSLEFDDAAQAERYAEAFNALVEAELTIEQGRTQKEVRDKATVDAISKAYQNRKDLFKTLGKIRQESKPRRKTGRLITAAKEIDKPTVEAAAAEQAGRVKEADESLRDYFDDEVKELTPEQIDILSDAEVEDAFSAAARWFAGRYRNLDLQQEGEDFISISKEGDPLQQVLEKVKTRGQKVKFIRRIHKQLGSREHGGRVKALPITKKGEKTRKGVHRRKAGFETSVLTRESIKADESKADRVKRKARAKKVYTKLETGIRNSAKFLQRFENQRSPLYRALQAKNEDGTFTDAANDLRFGRAYFAAMVQFADSLVGANNESLNAINEAERVDKFLRKVVSLRTKSFGTQLAKAARAEAQESFLAKPVGEDAALKTLKAIITDPVKRAETLAVINKRVLQHAAKIDRLNTVWKTNAFYVNMVRPLLDKYTNSIQRSGYMDYNPTQGEVEGVAFSMSRWRQYPHTKKDLYTPLRRVLRDLGFQFDKAGDIVVPVDKRGNFSWSANDNALEARYKQRFTVDEAAEGDAAFYEAGEGRALSPDEFNKLRQRELRDQQEQEDAGDFVALNKANGVIQRFLDRVNNPKTTINGLVRAEERLIRALKSLGLWSDTPSPLLGKVHLGRIRNYRIVGPRLKTKQLSKAQAKTLMGSIKPAPIPRSAREVAAPRFKTKEFVDKLVGTELVQETEYFLEVIAPKRNTAEFREAAGAVGDLLNNREVNPSVNTVLDMIIDKVNGDHIYAQVATRLRALAMDDLTVAYDWKGDTVKKNTAHYKRKGDKRHIYLNRNKLVKMRESGEAVEPFILHAILHETAHAATHAAINRDGNLKTLMTMLRGEARQQWQQQGRGAFPYGLQVSRTTAMGYVPVDEFVVEAFTNSEFQTFLKSVRINRMSLWDRFVGLLKRVLGLETVIPDTAFDVIMALEDQLFAKANVKTRGEETTLQMEGIDEAARPAISNVMDKAQQSMSTLNRIWDSSKKRGLNAPLVAMSMEQIADTFARVFGGKDGPLKRYTDAYFQRNAENSRLMEQAEALSRKWTELVETRGEEEAVAFSRMSTEATLFEVAANKPLNHKANEHLKSMEQKGRQRTLHKQFKAFDSKWQKLYNDLQGFYQAAIERETALLTLNAMRGIMTKGPNATMSGAEFETRFTPAQLRKVESKEDMEKILNPFLEESERDQIISTLHHMVTTPQQRKGNYFPLMRYGEYVVYATKTIESKVFSDNKLAFKFAADQRATDPTLDVSIETLESGDFKVRVKEKDFRTAESKSEAGALREEMVAEYGEDPVSAVMLKRERTAETAIASNAALNMILVKLEGNPAAQAAIKNFYLQTLSDSSFRKHEIKRKRRRGVDFEIQHRNFTSYAKQSSYFTSQLMYGWKMADGLQDMQKYIEEVGDDEFGTAVRKGQILRELVKRDQMTTDPSEIRKFVRRGVELGQFFMLISGSYITINASQPWMITLPWLGGKYGWGESRAALVNAQKLIISPLVTASKESLGGLKALTSKVAAEKAFGVIAQVEEHIRQRDPENAEKYVSMIEELRQNSIIDLTWIAELRDISEGRDMSLWQKVLDASRVMAHLTEVNNRILTAVAAYDLATTEALSKGMTSDEVHSHAVTVAKQAVSQTQFNYSAANKPRAFQYGGPLGQMSPLIFQFMQWPQHMYAMMISNFVTAFDSSQSPQGRREAKRILAGLFATHLAAGGIVGATIQPIKWAIGLAAMALGDEEDAYDLPGAVSGANFERMVQKSGSHLFGTTLGTALGRGLPTLAGIDVSRRMEIGTVFYMDFRGDNVESVIGSLASGLGGAFFNQVIGWGRGIQYMTEGEIMRAIEVSSPKIGKDLLKAWRYAREGLVNRAGDTVLRTKDVSAWNVATQAWGFQPSQVSTVYAKQSAIRDVRQNALERKSDLLKEFRTTAPENRRYILDAVREYNRRFPATRITRSTLIKAVRGKLEREAAYRRYGANISGKEAVFYRDTLDAY